MKRRDLIAAFALAPMSASLSFAQSSQGVSRIIVTYAAGGPTDVVARLLAPRLSERMDRQIIVENKPGAAGNVGSMDAARSAPDGHTVVLVAPTVAVNPSLYTNAVDPFKQLAPVTQLVSLQYVLVAGKKLPVTSLKGFIERARQKNVPPLTYGTWGKGSHAHLCAALLAQRLGVEMINVPYKGAAPAMQDVIAGQVDFMFDSAATAVPQARAGTVRALAVSSTVPLDSLPGVPPVASEVSGFDITGWQAVMAPAQTPATDIERWQKAIHATLHEPQIKERLQAIGLVPVGSPPSEFGAFLRSEYEKYAELIRSNGIKAD